MKKILLTLVLILSCSPAFGQWEPCNNGLTTKTIKSLQSYKTDLIAGTNNGIFVSTDNGDNWIQKNSGWSNDFVNAIAVKDGLLLAGLAYYGIYLSTDYGNSWNARTNGLKNYHISSLAFDGQNLIAGIADTKNDGGLYLSIDSGNTWKQTGLQSYYVTCLASQDNLTIAGTGYIGPYISSDNGQNWIAKNFGFINTSVSSLIIVDKNIYAGTFQGICISTNNGESWIGKTSSMFNGKLIKSMAVFKNNIFAATDHGIFLSEKSGDWFIKISYGLADTNINVIRILDGNIFVGTATGGIYRAKLSDFDITDVEEPAQTGNTLSLSPNPVQSSLTIHLDRKYETQTQIRIVDIHGRQVVESEIEAWITDKQIDLNRLTPGMYFVEMQSYGLSQTAKFIKI